MRTWDALQMLIFNRDTRLVISGEMSGLQQSGSRTSADSTDSRFTNIEKTLNEISNMVKNHQINETYDPYNPKMKQDFTRFCTYCKKSGHTMKIFSSLKKKKFNEDKAPPQPNETYSRYYPNRPKSPNKYTSNSNDRSTAQRGCSDNPYVVNRDHSRSNSNSATVRFETGPAKVNSLYDTLQSSNPLK